MKSSKFSHKVKQVVLSPVNEGRIGSVSVEGEMSPKPRRTMSDSKLNKTATQLDESPRLHADRKTQDDAIEDSRRPSKVLSEKNSPKGESLEVFLASEELRIEEPSQ